MARAGRRLRSGEGGVVRAGRRDGIGNRYIEEGRLAGEVERSADRYGAEQATGPAWASGFVPAEKTGPQEDAPGIVPDDEEEADSAGGIELPPMYSHGDPDPHAGTKWRIKKLMRTVGHGLLIGQWGTYKSFMELELSAVLMMGTSFLGRPVTKPCGVLMVAAEGQGETRERLQAMVQERCGNLERAPFCWFEDAHLLLRPGGLEGLVAMGRQAAASLKKEFGLPLGIIIVDTIAACAGYAGPGAENDPAIGQQIMNVLKAASIQLGCFVLGVDHLGKIVALGARGASSKKGSVDLVLVILGDREDSGRVMNTRIAVRKCRGGPSGDEHFFSVREVTLPGPDEDGEPVKTLVIDWTAKVTPSAGPTRDPWEQERRGDANAANMLLKRMLMAKLASHGCELPLDPPSDPPTRGIDIEIVREEFFAQTPAEGSDKQKRDFRQRRFDRAIERDQKRLLIGVREISGKTYVWLLQQHPDASKF